MKKFILIFLMVLSINLIAQKSIIIGDSQSYYIALNSKKASLYKPLYKIGVGLKYLDNKVKVNSYDYCVDNVFISIGVNDLYKYQTNNLVKNLKIKFPNAKLYMIKGSYGWGNVKTFNPNYYPKFGLPVLKNGIGYGEPHRNKKSYKDIGKEIDNLIK